MQLTKLAIFRAHVNIRSLHYITLPSQFTMVLTASTEGWPGRVQLGGTGTVADPSPGSTQSNSADRDSALPLYLKQPTKRHTCWKIEQNTHQVISPPANFFSLSSEVQIQKRWCHHQLRGSGQCLSTLQVTFTTSH